MFKKLEQLLYNRSDKLRINKINKSRYYDIWQEGYAVTGNSSSAILLMEQVEADSFKDACIKYINTPKGKSMSSYFIEDRLTIWGCRLFSDESSARKSFG